MWTCSCCRSCDLTSVPERKWSGPHGGSESLSSRALLDQDFIQFNIFLFKLKVRLSVTAAKFKCGRTSVKNWATWLVMEVKQLGKLPVIFFSRLSFRFPFLLLRESFVSTSRITNLSARHQLFYFHLSLQTISSWSLFFFIPKWHPLWEQISTPDLFCSQGEREL